MSEEIKQEEVKVEVEKEEVVKEKSMVKKVFGWIGTGFLTLLVVMASWLCFDKFVLKHRVPSIFGYSSLIVATGSMNGAEMKEGDLIIIKKTNDYKPNDIVTFFQDGDEIPTTHRIWYADGEGKWVTKGDANNSFDKRSITSDEIIGEVVLVIPYVCTFIDWAVEGGGLIYIVGIFLILGLGIYIIKSDDDEDEEESSEPTPSE